MPHGNHGQGPHRLADLEAIVTKNDDGHLVLKSPAVGQWREGPARGSAVAPGEQVGRLEVLGRFHRIFAPASAAGLVVSTRGSTEARASVGYDDELCVLDPSAGSVGELAAAGESETLHEGAVVFRAPSSGRYYARPGPDKPAFVEVGSEISAGQTVAILEVMKTFNRIAYGGAGLPARAKVLRVVPADGADINRDDVLLELEAL